MLGGGFTTESASLSRYRSNERQSRSWFEPIIVYQQSKESEIENHRRCRNASASLLVAAQRGSQSVPEVAGFLRRGARQPAVLIVDKQGLC
jgi:hypothetical protein